MHAPDSTVVVTGANGFVGQAVCSALIQRGNQVRKIVRNVADQFDDDSEIVQIPDIGPETDWTNALRGQVDVVFHLAARVHIMRDTALNPLAEFEHANTEGTEHLARVAAATGVKRFIYVSSIKVNGESTARFQRFKATDHPAPQDPYAVSKWQAEQALRRIADDTGLEIVIVRPPLVYGPRVKGNFLQLLKVLALGTPLPLASVRNQRSMVYVENLADALVLCATHPAAAGQTYLVNDGKDISTPDLLRHLGMAMGHPARLFHCPQALLKLAGLLTGKSAQIERLLGSLQIDSSKIHRELNWTPPYTLAQGLEATAKWYCNQYLHT